MNIHITNAADSSIDNYQKDENIAGQYRDTFTNISAIKIIPLTQDSLSGKAATTSENKSKNENQSSPKKKWFLEGYASPDISFNEITPGNATNINFIKKSFKTHLSYTPNVRICRSIDTHLSFYASACYRSIGYFAQAWDYLQKRSIP